MEHKRSHTGLLLVKRELVYIQTLTLKRKKYLTFIYTGSSTETQCVIYNRDLQQRLTYNLHVNGIWIMTKRVRLQIQVAVLLLV